MLKGIILGILIWNVICIIVAFITNENTEKVSICGCGLPIIIIWGISNIVRKIHEAYIKSKYNLYFFCNKDGNSLFSYAMTEEMANKFYIDGENDFYIELYKKGKDWKSLPGKSRYIKSLDEAPNNSGITYDYFKQFIKSDC